MLAGMSAPHRRHLLALATLAAAPRRATAQPDGPLGADAAEWQAFAARFLRSDGRVVDDANGGISHSEGQGWALLCAERAGDQVAFERILRWTRRHLARRGDALFAWRFRPDQGVDDPNNATDGDLMIAWALLRGGRRWAEAEYMAQAAAIARDVLRLLVRQVGEDVVLLPGLAGFEQREHVVVNPSYYAFPAMRALAQAVPDPLWLRLAADGIALLRRARFGRWGLPPDWLAVPRGGGRLAPAPGWPPRFSYDAVRVPLYLAWAGLGQEPAALAATRFWTDPAHPVMPAWADLRADSVSPYRASSGIQAILRLAQARQPADAELATPGMTAMVAVPAVDEANDYYSAVLTLLARLALRDSATSQM
jgi:endoglucanase